MTKVLVPLTMGLLVVACATGGQRGAEAGGMLIGREWVVEDVAGLGVVDGSRVTLAFGADGRLSGTGGCNRLIGSYVLRGAKLSISKPGMTRMACPPALMDQERRFADVLAGVRRFAIDATGALVLSSSDDLTITAR